MPNSCDLIISGHTGGEAETRHTKTGQSVTSFSVAYNPQKDNPIWFKCTLWGERLAEKCQKIEKGSAVKIYGRITNDRYLRQDGTEVPNIEVTCDSITVFPKKEKNTEETESSPLPF